MQTRDAQFNSPWRWLLIMNLKIVDMTAPLASLLLLGIALEAAPSSLGTMLCSQQQHHHEISFLNESVAKLCTAQVRARF